MKQLQNLVLFERNNIIVRPCSGGKCTVGRDKEGRKEGRKEGNKRENEGEQERKKASQDGL